MLVDLWKSCAGYLLPVILLCAGCRSERHAVDTGPSTRSSAPAGKKAQSGTKDNRSYPAPAKSGAAKENSAETAPPPSESSSKIIYSSRYDSEIRTVFELAKDGKWEEAEQMAAGLYERAPKDASVERLYGWVSKQRQLR